MTSFGKKALISTFVHSFHILLYVNFIFPPDDNGISSFDVVFLYHSFKFFQSRIEIGVRTAFLLNF